MSKVITSLVFVAAASVACCSTGAELLTNPDLDFPNAPPGWTLLETGGTPATPREAAKQQDFADFDGGGLGLWLEAFQGLFFGNGAEPVSAVLRQTVPGVPGETYTFSGYSFFDPGYSGGVETLDPTSPLGEVPSPTESSFEMAFLNAGGTVIGSPVSLDLRTEQCNGCSWAQHTLNGLAPTGTANVRVTASAIDMVPNLPSGSQSAFYDTFSLRRASSPGTEVLANADLNIAPDPTVAGWDTSGPHSYEGFSAHSGDSGFFLQSYQGFPDPLDATLLQTVAATPGTYYKFKGWSLFYAGYSGGVETLDPDSPYGEVPSLTETFFVMEFLNGSGTQIGAQTLDLRTVQMNDTTWREHTVTGLAPTGTTQVRVGVRVDDVMTNVDIPFQTANFDDFSLIAVLAGDYNGNGTVDAADYTVWRDNLGGDGSTLGDHRDPANTGVVSVADYNSWKANFGQTAGAGSGATAGLPSSANAAVPEPTALALLTIGLALLVPTARRYRRAQSQDQSANRR
jgi:hypothetical protein